MIISIFVTFIGLAVGILLALKTRRTAGLPYSSQIDTTSQVMNIVMLVVYIMATPMMWFLALVCEAYQEGFLGALGWAVAAVIWIAPAAFGLGLGASVALRKRGKSVAGFVIQFAGVGAIALSFLLYAVFVGSLLTPLN